MLNNQSEKIKEALERGVENVYPSRQSLAEKMASGKIKLYCGFDPTGPSLHLGHMIQLRKLGQFQKLGHEVIMLIGDFTGMIGDPTDKLATRKKLTREEVLKNSETYQKTAANFLDFTGPNPVKILYNSQWSDKLTFRDLIELAANFTVGQMISRDMFQKRLEENKPIFLHEFLYPLAQAYDSVAMDVDLEIGGNDQTFNMLCGRELMKVLKNKDKSVLTLKLLTDSEGKKMGKSEGNMVELNDRPENMFGKIMSWPDDLILPGLEFLTDVPDQEIKEIGQKMKTNQLNPRDVKARLAKEVVAICYDKSAAKIAEKEFEKIFKEKEAPSEIEEKNIAKGKFSIIDTIIALGFTESKSEAKRIIVQRSLKVDGVVKDDWQEEIERKCGQVYQVGKRKFKKIV
jgi:tyrosyl-tRNA synthetase